MLVVGCTDCYKLAFISFGLGDFLLLNNYFTYSNRQRGVFKYQVI